MENFKVDPSVIVSLGGVLNELARADLATRRELERQGVIVLPISPYCSIPSLVEVDSSFEYAPAQAPYPNLEIFVPSRLAETLEGLSRYAAEFTPAIDGDADNGSEFYWNNDQFTHSDALAYYCMVRRLRPRTILEVGSGFSTLIACQAMAQNGGGRVVCVEPHPRPFLARDARVELVRKTVQELDLGFFRDQLADGDFLFIDSTHTVKTGSDCLHLYLRILPHLYRDVVVHAHDVFLPFGLPVEWLRDEQIHWTEQYLLMALLLDNPRARVLFGSAYLNNFDHAALERFMAGKWSAGGGSLWFEYRGRRSG